MKRRKEQRITPEERRRRVYRERNRNLKAMGFACYRDYLASDLWKNIRFTILRGDPPCHLCGEKATQVHHRAYRKKDLEGRDLRQMYPICSACHRRIEFRDADGEKLNPSQATAKMRSLATFKSRRSAP